jgi:hypothetical protein
MANKMKMTIEIRDENGEIVKKEIEREIPNLGDFEAKGFGTAFGEIETAVLESRKTISEETIEAYMGEMSKKKSELERMKKSKKKDTESRVKSGE